MARPAAAPDFHHIALQTFDLDNSIAWYRDYFGCHPTWATDKFSELTRSRLPGILRMAEVALGPAHFHLFEREEPAGTTPPSATGIQFQHVCLSLDAPADLPVWRERWNELFASGRYVFLRPEEPTEIVVDDMGTHSFYCLDVNGLEFEFTCVTGEAR
ncbi:VOC family protein [Streptomyces sp. NRRL WC-3742]|uniref:VOC family protein n=1 Tax=Streptomyces sp. NRRL WC-3742 TaxID=1463934 RepID=UPI0004C728C3|nr:VOC family protein [Streptomyces sp. NRRL WC-3742]